MSQKLNIIFCVETGLLEQQALLLISSVKRWLAPQTYRLIAYSPRIDQHPSKRTLSEFHKNGVVWVAEEINKDFYSYPIANKVLACNHFVESNAEANKVMFLDTDTVFLNDIDSRIFEADKKVYVRPVDNKGPGSENVNDENDDFWQEVFSLCGVPIPETLVETTVRPVLIRGYFNAGLIWVQGIPGFFQQWLVDFQKILNSELRPFGYRSRDGDDFRCLDQVALAVTASRYSEQLEILPITYNYPVPFRPMMQSRLNHPSLSRLVHVHYHKWFQHPEFLKHISSDKDQLTDQYKWLESRLPLEPLIDDEFKC